MDEIAHDADVNKALIYYYFRNKKGLLNELIEKHLQETVRYKESLLDEIENYSREEIKTITRRLFELLENKKEILSILTIETIKSSAHDKEIFELLTPIFNQTIAHLEEKGYKVNNPEEKIFNLFFFGSIPMSLFLSLKDKWAEYYQTDKEELSKLFQEEMEKFYLSFYEEITRNAHD